MKRLVVLVAIAMTRVALADDAAPSGVAAPTDPGAALRDANAAATAGDWAKVSQVVQPLLARSLEPSDLGEAHRLAGLAAYFNNNHDEAEAHFLAYLKVDPDGHLDPSLYPPEVVTFLYHVRDKYKATLVAMRPPPRRYFVLNFLPPFGQLQNGDRGKALLVGGLLGATLATNITTYFVLRSWCHNAGSTCDDSGTDHFRRAQQLTTINTLAGLGAIAVYIYGVWDGVSGYRRRSREQRFAPYVAPASESTTIGVIGRF